MSLSAFRWQRTAQVEVARGGGFIEICRRLGRAGGKATARKRRSVARTESYRCPDCGFFPGSCECSSYAPTAVDVINAHHHQPGPLLR